MFFFDFDILAFFIWVVCGVCSVSNAEQQLTTALDVLFWNQIIKANQFFLISLRSVTSWFTCLRDFFVSRCAHFGRPITSIRAKGIWRFPLEQLLRLRINDLQKVYLVIT